MPLGSRIDWPAVRSLELVAGVIGVAVYVNALRDFGVSWRFAIDRERHDERVRADPQPLYHLRRADT